MSSIPPTPWSRAWRSVSCRSETTGDLQPAPSIQGGPAGSCLPTKSWLSVDRDARHQDRRRAGHAQLRDVQRRRGLPRQLLDPHRVIALIGSSRRWTLVVDEGFGSQDQDGRERIVEAIEAIESEFEKILVITHTSNPALGAICFDQ